MVPRLLSFVNVFRRSNSYMGSECNFFIAVLVIGPPSLGINFWCRYLVPPQLSASISAAYLLTRRRGITGETPL